MGARPSPSGELASPKKFVAGLRRGGIMPTIWGGARGIGRAFTRARVDAIRQAGDASAVRATCENSALIHRRLGRP
jgi:hypothetical protein